MDNFINDFWCNTYSEIKNQDWFIILANEYYKFIDDNKSWNEYPMFMLMGSCDTNDPEIQVLKELSLKDPSDIRWWISPHNCTIMNGFFMYIIMKKTGFNISIYESNSHIFLKDENGKVIDMYWQPLVIMIKNI